MSAQTLARIEKSESVALMRIIERAATDKDMDVSKLEKMLELKRQWDADNARKAFASAVADFQARCPTILKSKKADRYNYAPLDEILRTIRPHLDSCGLSLRFDSEINERLVTAVCHLSHRDGHTETSRFTAPIDESKSKEGKNIMNVTQQVGSANSYAKRYALCNALNLVGSEFDDDGYSAAAPVKPEDEPATDEQLAYIKEFEDASQIPADKLKWLNERRETLTVGDAKRLLVYLRKKEKAKAGETV